MSIPQTNFAPPFNITRVSHLVFTARDLSASSDFYVDHLDASGFFTLRPGDPKYAYNEPLAYTYWLLGDNRMLAPIPHQ